MSDQLRRGHGTLHGRIIARHNLEVVGARNLVDPGAPEPIRLHSGDVGLGSILLKKSEYRLGPIFSAPWVRFSDADAGGLVIYVRRNGASSKSIGGGS